VRQNLTFGKVAHQERFRFLKGPVPWPWLVRAAACPGKTLHVAVALWFQSGRTNSRSVRLTNKLLESLGVSRWSKYRALAHLSGAGLVQVDRDGPGNPVVTLLLTELVGDGPTSSARISEGGKVL
jgi:hypothetical protein